MSQTSTLTPLWSVPYSYLAYPVSAMCENLFPPCFLDADVHHLPHMNTQGSDPVDFDVLLNHSDEGSYQSLSSPMSSTNSLEAHSAHGSPQTPALQSQREPMSAASLSSDEVEAHTEVLETSRPACTYQPIVPAPSHAPTQHLPSLHPSAMPPPAVQRGIPNVSPSASQADDSSKSEAAMFESFIKCEEEGDQSGGNEEFSSAKRRAVHLSSEKRRRDNLGAAFDDLKQAVPSCRNMPGQKMSKEGTIRRAISYIHYLLQQRAAMSAEIQQLRAALEQNGIPIPPVNGATADSKNTVHPSPQSAASALRGPNALPESTLMLLFLGFVDAMYEEFMTKVNLATPEDLSMSLMSYLQQNVAPNKVRYNILNALRHMAANFSPSTDGSTCRIRKWLDALDGCNIAGFDDGSAAKVRGILSNVRQYF